MPARPWRSFIWPLAFLLAATLAVVGVRALLHDDGPAAPSTPAAKTGNAAAKPAPRFYRVRAGDTLATIAAATGVSIARLEQLNPSVEPTSLFIGARLRLR